MSGKPTFRIVIWILVVFAMQMSAIGISVTHQPNPHEIADVTAEIQSIIFFDDHDHGHSHPASNPKQQLPDNDHGHHNAANHSHELPCMTVHLFLCRAPLKKSWEIYPPAFAKREAVYKLERPPRLSFFS